MPKKVKYFFGLFQKRTCMADIYRREDDKNLKSALLSSLNISPHVSLLITTLMPILTLPISITAPSLHHSPPPAPSPDSNAPSSSHFIPLVCSLSLSLLYLLLSLPPPYLPPYPSTLRVSVPFRLFWLRGFVSSKCSVCASLLSLLSSASVQREGDPLKGALSYVMRSSGD